MRNVVTKLLLFVSIFAAAHVYAKTGPASLNISGALYDSSGTAITSSSVNFKIEIYDASGTCVLYSELHNGEDLSGAKGGFSLTLGQGTSKTNNLEGSSTFDSTLFKNNGATGAFTGCASGVTNSSGDTRLIRVYYDIGGGLVAMSPDVPITNSAYAMVADTLQGKTPSDFLQVNDDGSTESLSQANLENIFSFTNYPKLNALVSGSSSQYMVSLPSSAVSFNSQRITSVADPSSAQDVATKNYSDSYIGGKTADVSGVGSGVGDGATLVWDATLNKWTTGTPSATDNTKLPLAGGTMTGAIAMGAQDITNAGYITQASSRYLQFSNLTSGQETTLIASPLGAGNSGAVWYNSSNGVLKLWDGTGARQIVSLDSSSKLPALDGSQLTNIALPSIANNSVIANVSGAAASPSATTVSALLDSAVTNTQGAILYRDATGWTSLSPGTSGQFLQTQGAAANPQWASGNAGTVTSVASGTGLTGGPITTTGTLAVDVGTTANKIVQLDASAKLPAVDGSALTNVNATNLQSRALAATAPADGQVLTWVAANSDWEPSTPTGAVSSVAGKTGAVTLDVGDIGNSAGKYFGYKPNNTACANGELLTWDNTNSRWSCSSVSTLLGTGYVVNGGQAGAVTAGPSDANALTLQTAGTARVTIDASGNVGVGTTSPQEALTVAGHIAVRGAGHAINLIGSGAPAAGNYNLIEANSGDDSVRARFGYGDSVFSGMGTTESATGTLSNTIFSIWTNNTRRMTIDTSGNIGIGTTTPAAPLEVAGTIRTDTICDRTGANCKTISGGWGGATAGGSNTQVQFNSGGTLAGSSGLTWDNTNAALSIQGTSAPQLMAKTSDATGFAGLAAQNETAGHSIFVQAFGSSAAGTSFGVSNAGIMGIHSNHAPLVIGTADPYDVTIGASNTAIMTLKNGGNVGIGTASPNAKLDIQATNSGYAMQARNTAGTPVINMWPTAAGDGAFNLEDSAGTQTVRFEAANGVSYINTGGNVGIGTTTPAAPLEVAGTIRTDTICDRSGANCKTISGGWGAGGSVTSVGSGTGLTGGPITTSGTLAVDVGTTANKIVQLDASAKLPAVDGSQLTNIDVGQINSGAGKYFGYKPNDTACTNGQILSWDNTNSRWICATDANAGGTITALTGDVTASGSGSVAATIASNAVTTTKINDGAVTTSKLFTNPGVNRLVATDSSTGSGLVAFSCAVGEVMQWSASGWGCVSVATLLGTGYVVNGGQAGAVTAGSTDASALTFKTNNTARVTVDSSGNVGIGTTTPGVSLAVNGVIQSISGGFKFPDGTTQTTAAAAGTSTAIFYKCTNAQSLDNTNLPCYGAASNAGTGNATYRAYSCTIMSGTYGGAGQIEWASSKWQLWMGSWNDCDDGSLVVMKMDSTGGSYTTQWTAATGGINYAAGNVGIGTTSPAAASNIGAVSTARYLDVEGDGSASSLAMGVLVLGNNRASPAANDQTGVLAFNSSNNGGSTPPAYISSLLEGSGGANGFGGNLRFFTKDDNTAAAVERIRITPAGNVGIGTTSPTAKLEVNGGIKPGTATTSAACSPEGALGYDASVHAPVYCNSSAVWASVGGGGVTSQTTVSSSCSIPMGSTPCTTTTANCPTGYIRSGCSALTSGAAVTTGASPSGASACYCIGTWNGGGSTATVTCYAYCVK